MNTSGNLRTLAVLAVGICLILPTFSAPIVHKTYIIRHLPTLTETGFIFGLDTVTNEKGEEVYITGFAIRAELWDSINENHPADDTIVEEVSFEQLPLQGLFQFIKYRTDFYSELLPIALSKSSPKEVAAALPAELFPTLTPEAKEKISPEDLAELTKIYEQQ